MERCPTIEGNAKDGGDGTDVILTPVPPRHDGVVTPPRGDEADADCGHTYDKHTCDTVATHRTDRRLIIVEKRLAGVAMGG